MALLSFADLSIGYRGPLLLDQVSARIEADQRIGLLGRNGAGKTTLLKILEGSVTPDSGDIMRQPNLKVTRLVQDVPSQLRGTVHDVVVDRVRQELKQADAGVDAWDGENQWRWEHEIERTLTETQLDGQQEFATLSSGMKRRVLLAAAIASRPDILLLDEPTNHLDIPSILWLEQFLKRWSGTLIFITHDRTFLQNLATRIWEIDRGQLFDWSCDYATFLKRKEAAIEAQEKQDALFDKKLAEEEAWIRQGIKARRTRNEGRVRALKAMRLQRQQRRKAEGTAKLNLQQGDKSGALVAEVKKVGFAYDDRTILKDFSTTIMRGDKVGIIGRNGAGKTTLLRLLLGQLPPDEGNVRLGTNLQVAYFDQLRDTLDPEKTVQENVGEGSDRIRLGENTKHVLGYLQDFLFTPERARTQVKFLSGGERNRALLAKLMTRPANVLVMDEPTNDLDSETLELLEEQLADFAGTLLMVSHDRSFLNNVVTSTIVFEDDGVREYVGGYDDWQDAVARRTVASTSESKTSSGKSETKSNNKSKQETSSASPDAPRKLSYKEKRELEQLPERIETLEGQIEQLHQAMADADYYKKNPDELAQDSENLRQWQSELEQAFQRWEFLDS
ncbi:ATP-binding cassette domain-containing protein [Crateriforma conspicua]|uniref:ATP-binding cassette domain-containing protein n=1 Tax=Crateriforma conspicua TaxID=2527996 RepID=UPI00118A61C0|nr:ATP-binding cassette domain-containing protein [Crateriforma conspicua]QDV65894.1 ABC transporter ATP-binding protein uup [Crateriforma conspicua]